MSIIDDNLDYSMTTGMSKRIRECPSCMGQGNSMAVQITRKSDGFLYHCFRCHKSGYVRDRNSASPQQMQEIIKNGSKKKVDNRPEVVQLPYDFTEVLPPKGLVQLYDLSITDEDIKWFDIGWSQSHERIVVPVYRYLTSSAGGYAKKLTGVLGRKLDEKEDTSNKPKWWTQRQRDIKHPRFIGLPREILYDKQVVLVEDVFSAIRVSTTGRLAIGLLTTYLPFELYPVLQGWDVKIWLDADAYSKSVKYLSALGSNGIKASTVYTTRDPKTYSNEEINQAIEKGEICQTLKQKYLV